MRPGTCRKAIEDCILEHAKIDRNIFTVCTDSRGSVSMSAMAQEIPGQFIEAGIAEQNAVSVAAGLAVTGKKVFVSSPACFLSARAYEQVKIDVAYNRTDVKLVGASAGVSYGPLGCTHTSLHDYACMRSLPNIEVIAPADAVQARAVTEHLLQTQGPAYIRVGRGEVEAVYEEGEPFEMYRAKQVAAGMDATIIACGEMVHCAKEAARLLREEGMQVRVLDMFFLKPMDQEAVVRCAQETGAIVTVEEHSVHGGLGEAVAAIVAQKAPVPVRILGFPDEEYLVGKSNELFRYYGLTPEDVAEQVRILIRHRGRGQP